MVDVKTEIKAILDEIISIMGEKEANIEDVKRAVEILAKVMINRL